MSHKSFSEPYWKLLGVGLALSVALLAIIFWRSEFIIQGNFFPPPPIPTDTAFLQAASSYAVPTVDLRTVYYVIPKSGEGAPYIGNNYSNYPAADAQEARPILEMATGSRVISFTPSFDGKSFVISILSPPSFITFDTLSATDTNMSNYENTIVIYDVVNNKTQTLFTTGSLDPKQKLMVPEQFSPDNKYINFTAFSCPFCAQQPSGTYVYSLKNHELYNLGLKWSFIWSPKKSGAYSYKEVIKIPCVDNSNSTDYCMKDPDLLPWKNGIVE